MAGREEAILFIHRINKEKPLQEKVAGLKKGEWDAFFAIAREIGLELGREGFAQGCLSPRVNYFCPALIKFAGHLHMYKM